MSNVHHIRNLGQGAGQWNTWREQEPDVRPDLAQADLKEADLAGMDLRDALLSQADLGGSNLRNANRRRQPRKRQCGGRLPAESEFLGRLS